jgi:hypothetical protein
MKCCSSADEPICPCGQFVHPLVISNPPGLAVIAYRPGDYTSFRHALLLARAGESALTQSKATQVTQIWRPGANGDLAVQMIEWWAYLADVHTFYNERVANETYLRTANLPESVNRLIRLLGYRPRPGIGATGTLAALATGPNPFTLPKGFQIQSKPGPGKQPQIFELESSVTITPPVGPPGTNAAQGTANLEPAPNRTSVGASADNKTALIALAGTSSAVKVGDRVLLLQGPFPAKPVSNFVVATVLSVAREKDPQGNPYTNIGFSPDVLAVGADVTGWHLLTSNQSSQVWQYPASDNLVVQFNSAASKLTVDLAVIVRGIQVGDPIVFEFVDNSQPPQYGSLTTSTEAVWYANPKNSNPAEPPDPPTPAIPIPHTRITFGCELTSQPPDTTNTRPNYLVRYNWKDIGALIAVPTATVGGAAPAPNGSSTVAAPPMTLQPTDSSSFVVDPGTNVLVEDVNGNGALGVVDSSTSMHLADPVPVLVPPLRVLFNLLPVSRGKTVANEVLGNGNTLVAGQEFVLQNAPVTYLQDANSISGDDYSSTVRVWVNQVEWTEVRSFYGQPPGAQVFLTREDEQGYTHVVFGTRLPTGVNNVVASYRYGSGAEVPAAGSLTVVLQPQPGLRAVRNPVPVGGGADPDPPDKVRQLAPRSVLTFNRAVSVDDYEVIAAQAPGVVRAKAAVAFDPLAQRPRITVWVGDDQGAVDAAKAAFAATADLNRLPNVVAAKARVLTLSLTIVFDPRRDPKTVLDAVHTALVDPDKGLLGVNVVNIGEVFYDSQVYAACLAVPGVVAVHSLSFSFERFLLDSLYTRSAALKMAIATLENTLPELPPNTAQTSAAPPTECGQRHDPGEGAYLFLPDDPAYLILAQEAAS